MDQTTIMEQDVLGLEMVVLIISVVALDTMNIQVKDAASSTAGQPIAKQFKNLFDPGRVNVYHINKIAIQYIHV